MVRAAKQGKITEASFNKFIYEDSNIKILVNGVEILKFSTLGKTLIKFKTVSVTDIDEA